jgi:hypothetical protein
LLANNNIDFTYETFLSLLDQKKVLREVSDAVERLILIQSQFKPRKKDDEEKKSDVKPDGKQADVWMCDVAEYLIVSCGLDPHYVLYEMELYEMEELVSASLNKKKVDLAEKRLFTFLEMSPLRLGKNVKGPEDVMPFPWEKDEREDKRKKELAAQTNAVLGLFNLKKDGERRTDTDTEQE